MSAENSSVPPDPVPPPSNPSGGIPTDPKQIMAKLDLAGKLLGGGAIVGIVATFLPIVSISIPAAARDMIAYSSPMVLDAWHGKLLLLGYAATLFFVYRFYFSNQPVPRNILLASVGVAGAVVVVAFILFIDARRAAGFGTYLSVLAAAAVGYGGFLKAKESKVI